MNPTWNYLFVEESGERGRADQGTSGNEIVLFKTSTNTKTMEALNGRAGKSVISV